jgi:hypothetical protein
MLTVVKPSPLRLWGFLLTVLGGGLIAVGSISDWAAISLGSTTLNAVPTKGIDVWQGKATLALGVLIVVAILGLRVVRAERRGIVAVGIVVLAVAASGIAVWSLTSPESVAGDTGVSAIAKAAEEAGMSAASSRQIIAQLMDRFGIEIQAQAGLWFVIAGGVLAIVGGLVDLLWVRRKRIAGDAIDPDTVSAVLPGPRADV